MLLLKETREKLLRPQLVGFRNLRKSLGKPLDNINDKGFWDNGCSRHMTRNISNLSDYEPYDGGYVSFGYGGGKITGKGTIKTGKGTINTTYFKLEDDRHVLLRTPRQQNMYDVDLKDIIPHKNLTCLIAKASVNESMLWHRRLGHLNFKTMNKLVRNNLVIGLPSKIFKNDHSCVDCLKGKQHKASCKSKLVNSTSKPLHTLHMDRENPWGKDGTGKDVDLHLYRSMIGSLMYLTASRPDIMFVVCACARHQVTPKECHLHAVKRIFRYLKGHPKLGLWYPKESLFDLVAYSDSDYSCASQDRKSTTGGC
ncbi:ribonuclease H-like domain-containing protein [Tanacetum coccineum]